MRMFHQSGPAAISAIRFLIESNDHRRLMWSMRVGPERLILWIGRTILSGPVITLALIAHLLTADDGPLIPWPFGFIIANFQILLFVLLFNAIENRWRIFQQIGRDLAEEEQELLTALHKAMQEEELS